MQILRGRRVNGDLDEVRFYQCHFKAGPKQSAWKVRWIIHRLHSRYGVSVYWRGRFYFVGLTLFTDMRTVDEPAAGHYGRQSEVEEP